jgi:hypothetical protein
MQARPTSPFPINNPQIVPIVLELEGGRSNSESPDATNSRQDRDLGWRMERDGGGCRAAGETIATISLRRFLDLARLQVLYTDSQSRYHRYADILPCEYCGITGQTYTPTPYTVVTEVHASPPQPPLGDSRQGKTHPSLSFVPVSHRTFTAKASFMHARLYAICKPLFPHTRT